MCSEDLPHVLLLSVLPCILFPIASHFDLFVQSPTKVPEVIQKDDSFVKLHCNLLVQFSSKQEWKDLFLDLFVSEVIVLQHHNC
jgi:hypothetical protein